MNEFEQLRRWLIKTKADVEDYNRHNHTTWASLGMVEQIDRTLKEMAKIESEVQE